MNNGMKERMRQLAQQDSAARAIGHGVLDCPESIRDKVAEIVLPYLVNRAPRLDMFLAMDNQGISPPETYRTEFEAEVSKHRERREKQAESARFAREELAAFRTWQSKRQRRVNVQAENKKDSGRINNVEDTGNDD